MKTSRLMLTATALLLVAGSAVPAQPATQPRDPSRPGQPERPQPRQQQPGQQQPGARQPGQTEAAARGYQLVPTEWAIGADIVNAQDEELGSLEDLVLEANSGRIVNGIVSHGGVLGIGGKNVAVPWQSFRWDPEDRRFILQMTSQQLEQAPEFDRDQLSQRGGQGRPGGAGLARGQQDGDEDGWGADGEYQQMVSGGQRTQVQGSATNISRESPISGMNEGIIITIESQDQGELEVHLGPAWFIDRQDVMLRLGDDIRIEGVRAEVDGRNVVIAHTLSGPHGEFRLRDQRGNPVWDTSVGGEGAQQRPQPQRPGQPRQQDREQPRQPGQNENQDQPDRQTRPGQPNPGMAMAQPGRTMQEPRPQNGQQPRAQDARAGEHHVLLTEIDGQTVTTLGEEDLGEVEDIVFDAMTGKVAFVVLSAGVLGGDFDNVALPWDMVRVEPDGRLLASQVDRDRLENAPKIEDWDDLDDPRVIGGVYQHFGVQNPFEQGARLQRPGMQPGREQPGQQQPRQPGQQGAGQDQAQQKYIQLFTGGQQASVTGTVQGTQQAAPMQGLEPIMILTVTAEGGEQQTVHLAPQQFLQKSNLTLGQGDQVTVQGRKATVDGKQVVIANQVQKNGQSINLRGADGKPAWESPR